MNCVRIATEINFLAFYVLSALTVRDIEITVYSYFLFYLITFFLLAFISTLMFSHTHTKPSNVQTESFSYCWVRDRELQGCLDRAYSII